MDGLERLWYLLRRLSGRCSRASDRAFGGHVFRGGADYPEVVHAHQQSGAHQLRSRLFDLQTGAGSSLTIVTRPDLLGIMRRSLQWLAESLFSMLGFLATLVLLGIQTVGAGERYYRINHSYHS
jgi:hypothetical protein